MNEETVESQPAEIDTGTSPLLGVDVTDLVFNSPVLARLIEEVRSEHTPSNQAYNRMHNRHNRSR